MTAFFLPSKATARSQGALRNAAASRNSVKGVRRVVAIMVRLSVGG